MIETRDLKKSFGSQKVLELHGSIWYAKPCVRTTETQRHRALDVDSL